MKQRMETCERRLDELERHQNQLRGEWDRFLALQSATANWGRSTPKARGVSSASASAAQKRTQPVEDRWNDETQWQSPYPGEVRHDYDGDGVDDGLINSGGGGSTLPTRSQRRSSTRPDSGGSRRSSDSPGTKFVRELAELLPLRVDHREPLAQIMDQYYVNYYYGNGRTASGRSRRRSQQWRELDDFPLSDDDWR
jgi:hypothetical protein